MAAPGGSVISNWPSSWRGCGLRKVSFSSVKVSGSSTTARPSSATSSSPVPSEDVSDIGGPDARASCSTGSTGFTGAQIIDGCGRRQGPGGTSACAVPTSPGRAKPALAVLVPAAAALVAGRAAVAGACGSEIAGLQAEEDSHSTPAYSASEARPSLLTSPRAEPRTPKFLKPLPESRSESLLVRALIPMGPMSPVTTRSADQNVFAAAKVRLSLACASQPSAKSQIPKSRPQMTKTDHENRS